MPDSIRTPLHRYVEAFNERDAQAMSSVFADDLRTIHPAEPEIDVTTSRPFLERMQSLWGRGITYQITRYISTEFPASDSEVWGELLAFDSAGSVVASEIVLYRVSSALVREICVYKVMAPSHPNYQISPAQ